MRNSFLSSTASTVATVIALLAAFLSPLIFFPFVPSAFEVAKTSSVIFLSLLLVILFAVVSIILRTVAFSRSLFTLGFGLLALSTGLSIVFSSPNKAAALTGIGMFWIAASLLFIVLTTLIRKRFTTALLLTLGAASALGTIFSVLEKVGVNFFSFFGMNGSPTVGVFPNGGALVNVALFVVVACMLVTLVIVSRSTVLRAISIAMVGILVIGILLNGVAILPGQPQSPVFLSFGQSWGLALDILKTPKAAVIGVGPEQYANAFALYKSSALNATPYWFVRFGTAHNLILDFVVTHGVMGLASLATIAAAILFQVRKTRKEDLPLFVGIVGFLLVFFLMPANPVLFALFVVILAAWYVASAEQSPEEEKNRFFTLLSAMGKEKRDERHVATGMVAALALGLFGVAAYILFVNVNSVFAYSVYNKALDSLRANKAKETYDLARRAITLTPYREEMRRSFSQVNLTIALGLTQQKDLSEADRKTAITLVSQAINEAKAATALNPTDSTNWENLALVYNTLIGSAAGADQWTVAAYTQAIIRDPANPKLRFDLGAVYRRLKNDDSAQRLFEQAIQLKADYANAYYNLADIAKSGKKPEQEYVYLQRTLQLIKTSDPQYDAVKQRSDALAKELGDKIKAAQEQLKKEQAATPPVASPSASLRPLPTVKPASSSAKLDLPSSAGIASSSAVPELP